MNSARGSHSCLQALVSSQTFPSAQRYFVITMGLTFSSIFDSMFRLARWGKEKDVRILMLGLDSAGKVRVADQF